MEVLVLQAPLELRAEKHRLAHIYLQTAALVAAAVQQTATLIPAMGEPEVQAEAAVLKGTEEMVMYMEAVEEAAGPHHLPEVRVERMAAEEAADKQLELAAHLVELVALLLQVQEKERILQIC